MPLQKSISPIVIGQGINTKVDPKLLPIQSNIELDNVRIEKQGTINKRYGYEALTMLSNPTRLFGFKDSQLLATSEQGLKVSRFSPALGTWALVGYSSPFTCTLENVTNADEGQCAVHWAQQGNFLAVVYSRFRGTADQGIYLKVFDATNNLLLVTSLISSSATRGKVVAGNQNDFYIVYNETVNLKCVKFNVLAQTLGSAQTVATSLDSALPYFDVKWHPIFLRPVIAWNDNAPDVRLGYLKVNGQLETSPSSVTLAGNADNSIAIGIKANGQIGLAWCNATPQLSFALFDFVNLTQSGSTTTQATTEAVSGITYSGVYLLTTHVQALVSNQPINHFTKAWTPTTTGSWTDLGTVRSVGVVSEAHGDYCILGHESVLQPTYFILHIPSLKIVGKIAGLNAGGLAGSVGTVGTAGYSIRANALSPFDGSQTLLTVKNGLESVSGQLFGFRNLARVTLVANPSVNAIEVGSLLIAGSLVHCYDGNSISEAGFNLFPENVTASTSAGTGAAGLYGYAVTYSWEDGQNLLWESAPFIGAVNLPNNHQFTLVIPTLRLTTKPATVVINVYRTVANGTVYYKHTDSANPTYNDTSVDTVSITVNPPTTDTAITSKPLLYTTGGVLENDQAPSCGNLNIYRTRIVYSGLEQKNTIAYSKTLSATEPPNWSALYTIPVPQGGEQVSFTATMDEKLIIFKPSYLALVVGDGPLDTGLNSDFQNPTAIAADVGSANPQSVVGYLNGLLFQSAKGIYQLDRGLNVSYIGAPVETFNSLTVTAANLLDDVNELRFSTNGRTLVYNYYFQQWITHSGLESISASVLLNTHYIVKTDGQVWNQSADFNDDGAYISATIITGWLAAGLQGFQRIYKLYFIGSLESTHTLKIQLGYDYQDNFQELFFLNTADTFPVTTFGESSPFGAGLFGGGFDGVYQFQVLPSKQKCEAMRIKISDLSANGLIGEGFSLTAISAMLGVKQGLNKMPATRRVTGSGRAS